MNMVRATTNSGWALCLLFCILPSAVNGVESTPALVAVVGEDVKSIVGELGRENGDHIEVIDLRSGQSQIFRKSSLRSIKKDVTTAEVIDRVGLPAFMSWRIKRALPDEVSRGKVAEIDGSDIYISLGKTTGLEVGEELIVYRTASDIKDPDTGAVIGKRRKRVATLEAMEVDDKLTKAKQVGETGTALVVGDIVEPALVSNSIAVLPVVNPDGHETIGSKRISEELITGLVNREVSVIERRLLDKVLSELSLEQNGVFDAAHAQKVGKQLGVYAMVIGTVTAKNKFAEAQFRLVRVETGEIMISATQTFRDVGDLLRTSSSRELPQLTIDESKAYRLLDADSLKGWETVGRADSPNWKVTKGILTQASLGPSLATSEKFENFNLYLEFSLPPKCNTGIYLRGRYEVQLLDSLFVLPGGKPVPPDKVCGAIWGQIPPSKYVYIGPDRWNTLDVLLVDRTVTVRMNKVTIIDAKSIGKVTGGALDENESEPGPIIIQSPPADSRGETPGARFRNIIITKLP
jgi:TolB-like protein